jgi:iron complex transport system ATP-binding protein
MNCIVSVDNVGFWFGQSEIIHDVTFQINSGELLVIIGPNGSGKTSLMKLMAGIVKPVHGRIEMWEKDIHSLSRRELARRLAYVPQNVHYQYAFTVKETVLMGRSPHLGLLGLESSHDEAIAQKAMEATQTTHLASRRMDQLSGGEQQRVLIARALTQEPDILLLDEPTSALDLSHQILVMDLLEQFKKEYQVTIVMIAHDLNIAALYGDRLLLLHKGRIFQIGAPSEVLTFENLEKVYKCILLVDESSLDKIPQVSLIPGRYLDPNLSRFSNFS